MNLAFSTTFPKKAGDLYKKPTHFGNKILIGINKHIGTMNLDPFKIEYAKMMAKHGIEAPPVNFNAKIHTIRRDLSKRWKKGRDIHFVMFQRTKDQFRFAPVLKCTETQEISIKHFKHDSGTSARVFIDGKNIGCIVWNKGFETEPIITGPEMIDLAINDGFESVEDFFRYFNEDFEGTLVHWTGVRYGSKSIAEIEGDFEEVTPFEKAIGDSIERSKDRKCDCWLKNETCKCSKDD